MEGALGALRWTQRALGRLWSAAESCQWPLPLLGPTSAPPTLGLAIFFPQEGNALSFSFMTPHPKFGYHLQNLNTSRG